jgi:hypothetical protein
MSDDYKIPPQDCLKCGYHMAASTDPHCERGPRAGDICMCLMCGAIMVFKEDLMVRLPSEEERRQISLLPHIIEADIVRAAVTAAKKSKNDVVPD